MSKKFDILTRKNLGDKAIWKRAEKLNFVTTVVGGDYAIEWINKKGSILQVYYLANYDTKKIVAKYVWNKDKKWHTTAYEQQLNETNQVNSEKTNFWYSGNTNKNYKTF